MDRLVRSGYRGQGGGVPCGGFEGGKAPLKEKEKKKLVINGTLGA